LGKKQELYQKFFKTDVSSKILLVLLFMVKKEVFEWIRTGQKNIELGRGKGEKGFKIT